MKTVEDREKFIELRACGMSFAKIVREIGISKPTLIKWNVELRKEIENRRYLAVEELLEQYKLMQLSRIQIFSEMLARALDELRSRDFSLLSFKDLARAHSSIRGQAIAGGRDNTLYDRSTCFMVRLNRRFRIYKNSFI